jgi:hypothetical protein
MVKLWRSVTTVSVSIACIALPISVVVVPDALAANKPLPHASTFVLHGTHNARGECEFTTPPSATHQPGEGTIEVRPIGNDEQSCTQTWERGTPSAAELAAEGVPSGSPHSSSVTESAPPLASAAKHRTAKAHAASTIHKDYVYAREVDAFGSELNSINVTVEYETNGSSITSCPSLRAKWKWSSEEGWALETHNDNTGCSTSQAYSSAYGLFNNFGGCQPEYNRTAVFVYPNGSAQGYGPIYKCYNPPPYAWYLN